MGDNEVYFFSKRDKESCFLVLKIIRIDFTFSVCLWSCSFLLRKNNPSVSSIREKIQNKYIEINKTLKAKDLFQFLVSNIFLIE